MNKIKTVLIIAIAALAAWSVPASADPVYGDAAGNGGDGSWVEFYIPLDGVRIYDGTPQPDSCSTSAGECLGGTLHLFMDFVIGWSGETIVNIDFMDLDNPDGCPGGTYGCGDNSWFSELLAIVVTDADGSTSYGVDAISQLLTGNSGSQNLTLNLDLAGDFEIEFVFTTNIDREGYFYNTPEYLRARAHSVPEPGTLALLGAGLLLLGFSRRRKLRI